MALPIRATLEDVQQTCNYLANKPTGATSKEIKSVLGEKLSDARRLLALKTWSLITETEDGHYKVTDEGRSCLKSEQNRIEILKQVIRSTPAYLAIVERAAHRNEDSLSTNDVASHWHDHFKDQVGDSEDSIKEQTMCFFQLAGGAGLGTLIVGRRGAPTRFTFNMSALKNFATVSSSAPDPAETPKKDEVPLSQTDMSRTGQGIFIAHGKNKKPLEQLKKILDQFKIPYKIAVDEPNLGRPISGKVRDIMHACNCAILIFSADEEFRDKDGKTIWRPSENVVYELGATGFLYDNRIVIMKEDGVTLSTNFRDIGYISFAHDQLDAKTMDILKELIGFEIVKIST